MPFHPLVSEEVIADVLQVSQRAHAFGRDVVQAFAFATPRERRGALDGAQQPLASRRIKVA